MLFGTSMEILTKIDTREEGYVFENILGLHVLQPTTIGPVIVNLDVSFVRKIANHDP